MEANTGQIELVKDIDLGDLSPGDLIEFNDLLYFSADDGENGDELWVSDGTAEGTQLLADIRPNDGQFLFENSSYPSNFIEFNDRLFFTADNGESGEEPWVSDGTTEGTQLLADIRSNDNDYSFGNGSLPKYFTVFGDQLFFSADDGENGRELWVTDGTSEGTQLLLNLDPGVDGSYPEEFLVVDDLLYFSANGDFNSTELWVSDGTAEGTQLVKDINSGFDYSEYIYDSQGNKSSRVENPFPLRSDPKQLTEFNGKVYFSADDGINGRELWVSDGTEAGTQLVKDINPGTAENGVLKYSDPQDLIQFQDRLYFSADDGVNGRELWVSDGTAEGTQLVKDINPNSTSSSVPGVFNFVLDPSNFIEFDDRLFFTADDGVNGDELWVTDGTSEGTQLIKNINPIVGDTSYGDGSNISEFTEFNGRLYFAARADDIGKELWVTDGTTEGTQLVEDLSPGLNDNFTDFTSAASSQPESLTVVGDELFFAASDGETERKLFKLTADNLDSDTDVTNSNNVDEDSTVTSGSSSVESIAESLTLTGDDSNDRLTGNSGDDSLVGNLGNDTLTGGGGADVFILQSGKGTDTITDFDSETDRLGLSSGLQFDDLTFSGQSILQGEEVLAELNGIDTENLTASDFEFI